MDIIMLIILVQFYSLVIYVYYLRFYFLLSTILFFLYFIFKYHDGDEETGFRYWKKLRNYTFFGKSVIYFQGNPTAFKEEHMKERTLFVVVGNLSNMGLFHGFGFHGGVFKHIDLVYMLPDVLFKIPFLRDFLLWSGAVSETRDSEGAILRLLKKGKSVAYAPSGMSDTINYSNPRGDDPEKVVLNVPSQSIFEFAMKHKIHVVPVLISFESQRYVFLRGHWVHRIQKYSYPILKWPFPLLFFPRIFSKKIPPKMEIQLGFPMDSTVQESAESFSHLFMGQFAGLAEVGGGGNKEILINA